MLWILLCVLVLLAGTDDQLVVVGGFGSHQNLVDVVEKYDPKTHTWTRLPVSLSMKDKVIV
jgi:N-acetylneuraminic acid mutarotase